MNACSTTVNGIERNDAAYLGDPETHGSPKVLSRILASVGDQLGVFRELALRGAATAPELARRTGLDEGWLSEWLAAMVTTGELDYDDRTRRLALPVRAPRGFAAHV
jgi:hypothetical protein